VLAALTHPPQGPHAPRISNFFPSRFSDESSRMRYRCKYTDTCTTIYTFETIQISTSGRTTLSRVLSYVSAG
jgi:hypothetical protein